MPVLGLRVEHEPSDRIVLTLNSEDEFFALVLISGEDIEEVCQRAALAISISLDDPVVSVHCEVLQLQLLEELLGELLKQLIVFGLIDPEVNFAGLFVDFDYRQRILGIFIRKVMDELKTLTDGKNWEVDVLLVFLLQHIIPDALGHLVPV